MSQFDAYKNSGRNRKAIPYVLDIQSELLSSNLSTRVVIPLYRANLIKYPVYKLHVPINFMGKKLLALFDEISSVENEVLGHAEGNLTNQYAESFKTALDVLFYNYP